MEHITWQTILKYRNLVKLNGTSKKFVFLHRKLDSFSLSPVRHTGQLLERVRIGSTVVKSPVHTLRRGHVDDSSQIRLSTRTDENCMAVQGKEGRDCLDIGSHKCPWKELTLKRRPLLSCIQEKGKRPFEKTYIQSKYRVSFYHTSLLGYLINFIYIYFEKKHIFLFVRIRNERFTEGK